MSKPKRDSKGKFLARGEGETYYCKLKAGLKEQIRRTEKRTGKKFTEFLNRKAEQFINLNGVNKKFFNAIGFCYLCKKESDYEQNDFIALNEEEDKLIFISICPECKKRLIESNVGLLSDLDKNFREQLLDYENEMSQGGCGSDFDFFIELIEDNLSLMEYEVLEQGKVIINNIE